MEFVLGVIHAGGERFMLDREIRSGIGWIVEPHPILQGFDY